MKKCVYLLIALLPVLFFFGCPDSPPGDEDLFSEDALIISFNFDGIEGEAVIDLEDRTITITTIPMDLSGIEPEISISEGAVLGEIPVFEDGVPADILVTAEDGTVEQWTVTIHVRLKIGFHQHETGICQIIHMEEFPPGGTGSPYGHCFHTVLFCFMKLPDQGRQDMGGFKVKIIIGAVKIGGHDWNKMGLVLPVIRPAHFNSGNFSNSIG